MARKAIVDKDIILNMLREGETTQRIADKFSVSRQAIDLYRRNFIEKGLLPDQRAVRTKKTKKEGATNKQNLTSLKEASPSKDIITLDKQIDLIIDAFNALKRLPHLEREIEKYKQEYESALKEIERLRDNEKKRLDQESRWLLSQHQNGTDPA
jgi:transposase